MTDTMLPIIRQMHDADGDRARARILLQCPDAVLLKYRNVFEDACSRVGFDLGLEFIAFRVAGWNAVRMRDGTLPAVHEDVRAAFSAFADDRGAV